MVGRIREELFVVKYISVHNCFLYLPNYWLRKLTDGNSYATVLKVVFGFKKAYFSWNPEPVNFQDSSLCLSATYASTLGLCNEDTVLVSLHSNVVMVCKAVISPVNSEDWEILEQSSDVLQSSILDQIHVVWPGQEFIVWVSKAVHIVLHIESLEPACEVGRLGTLTEVVVVSPKEWTPNRVGKYGLNNYAGHRDSSTVANFIPQNSKTNDICNDPSVENAVSNPTDITNDSAFDNNVHSSEPNDVLHDLSDNYAINDSTNYMNYTNNSKVAIGIIKCPETDVTFDAPSELDSVKNAPSGGSAYQNNSKVTDGVLHTSKSSDTFNAPFRDLFWDYLKHMSPFRFGEESTIKIEKMDETSKVLEKETSSQYSMLRVHPFVVETNMRLQPYCVFIHRTNWSYINKSVYCKLTYIPFPPKPNNESTENHGSVFVKVNPIEDTVVTYNEQHCVLVPEAVQKTLHLKAGSRVVLEPAEIYANTKTQVVLQVTKIGIWEESVEDVELILRRELLNHSKNSPVLISSGALFPLQTKEYQVQDVVITLLPTELQYVLLGSEDIRNAKIIVNPDSSPDSCSDTHLEDFLKLNNLSFSWADGIITEGLFSLDICLGIRPSIRDLIPSQSRLSIVNTLIVGKCGSGRSTLARLLCSKMSQSPYFVHIVEFQCGHAKGKNEESVHKLLNTSLLECVYHQPSVLFLDDLQELASVTSEEQENFEEVAYYSRISEIISLLLEEFQATNSIAVIATASSMSNLNPALASSHGHHIFKTVLQVPELTKVDRLSILKNIISTTNMAVDSSVDVENIARRCDGYIVQDLVDLCDKAVFEACKRNEENVSVAVEDSDFATALNNMTPLSLQGIELYRCADHSWKSVGGLAEVKEILVELMMWPSQYPELYSQSPLRQQTGILLYGAPGTGKTLLAGALANECDLNFISVKGPELLSKYIGSSEESVRDVFQKAQGAKPCILFFDEFESLAPRRGHDSTGVTDRVVNQLLTQLDGVESLVGVWVIAASNRPDLLDPALLRPGRLDRCIECPIPDQVDRLAILIALSCKLHLADDVDLDELASHSEGFTGADLQAVLCTAQLMAVEKKLDTPTAEDDSRTSCLSRIDQQLLLAALKDTRPSLTPQERRKYDIINKKFSNTQSGAGVVEDFKIMQQRTTLA